MWDYFWRGVQVAGGVAEVAGGVVIAAGGSLATAGVGSPLAIAGGGGLALHGLDQIQAGLRGVDSISAQAGTAIVGNVFGEEYGWIGGILGDIGPGIGGIAKGGAAGARAIMKGVKDIPQLVGKLRSLGGAGAVRSFVGKMNPSQLKKFLGKLSDDEIAKMVKNGELTDDDLIKAGLDPKKYKGKKVSKSPKKVSLREKYMGRTPGKDSRTGREVIERMKGEGKIRTGPDGSTMFKASDGKWYDLSKADMAHKTDAVSWWNSTGRQFGAKAPEVRQWMLDSNNYYLEHFSINRSAGASLGQTYKPPL